MLKRLNNKPQKSAAEAYEKMNDYEALEKEELIGKTWGRMLKNNKTLLHLDLSHNYFSEDACKEMGKRLIKNHAMFGLHMEGNCCSIDPQGFIVVNEAITAAALAKSKEDVTNPVEAKPSV